MNSNLEKYKAKIKRQIKRNYDRIEDYKNRKEKLSESGHWQLGYYEGVNYALENLLDDIDELSSEDLVQQEDSTTNEQKQAYWLIWAGWTGNHDQRIEDATCTNCGYKHPTVHRSTSNLGKFCGSCQSVMSIKTFG